MCLSKSLTLILAMAIYLVFSITTFAHDVDNEENKVHRVIQELYDLSYEDVHADVTHNHNNFKASPDQDCGYRGGHSGYDVAHDRDEARFYSLTEGVVVKIIMPDNPDVDLSYLVVYNEDDDKTILYLHLSSVRVDLGDSVDPGDYLGRQGLNSNFSTGYHIHLEVRNGSTCHPSCGASPDFNYPNVDPIDYLHGKLTENEEDEDVFGAPSQVRILTQTWGDLKSGD